MEIQFKKLYPDVQIPACATVGSAGFDLVVHNFKQYYIVGNTMDKINSNVVIEIEMYPNSRLLVGCGFSVAIPEGYVMDIRSRSGNALKHGIVVLNSPGTIDSDYRGEIGAILHNNSTDSVIIRKGDRIAQGLVLKFDVVIFKEVNELSATERGEGGFGSTGVS
jgi:dUTP pyrophosphatase